MNLFLFRLKKKIISINYELTIKIKIWLSLNYSGKKRFKIF